jgi:predicted ATPase
MARRIHALRVENYRSLASLELRLGDLNVLFGPCGVGKSTLLDSLWFLHDCLIRDVIYGARRRGYGLGMLRDGAEPGAAVVVEVQIESLSYRAEFSFSAGQIVPQPQELLIDRGSGEVILTGHGDAFETGDSMVYTVPDVRRRYQVNTLALAHGIETGAPNPAHEIVEALAAMRRYVSRSFDLDTLTTKGSEPSFDAGLDERARSLWSVLRGLKDRRERDDRYDTIVNYMIRAFPATFEGLMFEQLAPTVVYASMLESSRNEPIKASGISDGHMQMLIILTALFGDPRDQGALLLFDEPETSLHPWPLAVMGEAMREAASAWNRQIVVATHSPVLISQFEPDELIVVESTDGQTKVRRASEIAEVADLLEQFAAGSIYMAQAIAPQGGQPQE